MQYSEQLREKDQVTKHYQQANLETFRPRRSRNKPTAYSYSGGKTCARSETLDVTNNIIQQEKNQETHQQAARGEN